MEESNKAWKNIIDVSYPRE